MNIPGVSGAVGHAASAALFVDGQLVAAVEEERFLRDKHARENYRCCRAATALKMNSICSTDLILST
jgi:carbamoyltransferase